MAKKTLLEIVQDILNDAISDEVNSINDTLEAQSVANIVRTTYEEIISNRKHWPHLFKIGQLDSSGDSDKPNYMTLPSEVTDVSYIKYNKRQSTGTKDEYSKVYFKQPEDFLEIVNTRDSSSSSIDSVVDDSGITLFILNDRAPVYWTTIDDNTIIFDAYDSSVDSTLQSSKTQVAYYKNPTFSLTDSFIPDLPAKAFPYLISESKSVAFNSIFQAPNAKEEQRSRRQRNRLSREAWRAGKAKGSPNFGRKP